MKRLKQPIQTTKRSVFTAVFGEGSSLYEAMERVRARRELLYPFYPLGPLEARKISY